MSVFRGLDMDGVFDVVASIDADGSALHESDERLGSIFVAPKEKGEKHLSGDEARAASALSAKTASNGVVSSLDVVEWALDDEGSRDTKVAKGDGDKLLAAYLSRMASADARTTRGAIVVPDTSREEVQRRILSQAARATRAPVELLWRPVATILGWTEALDAEERRRLAGRAVVHVHLGSDRVECSHLTVNLESHDGVEYLVPARSGRGTPRPGETRLVRAAWRAALEADRRRHRLDDVAVNALQSTSRPWAISMGRDAEEAIVPTASGGYVGVRGQTACDPLELSDVMTFVEDRLALVGRGDVVLVDGAGCNAWMGAQRLGQWVVDAARARSLDAHLVDRRAAALGAASYARRVELGLPTYDDVLPRLQVYALKQGRHEWIDLVGEGLKVRGGKAFGPHRVEGFAISAGSTEVEYAITREGDATVRTTSTSVPLPARSNSNVTLYVTQRPGQGFALVEIRPHDVESMGWEKVSLNWDSMKDTRLSTRQYVEEQKNAGGFGYPDTYPMPCHELAWTSTNLERLIRNLLVTNVDSSQGLYAYSHTVKQVQDALSSKVDPHQQGNRGFGPKTHGPVDSNGCAPDSNTQPSGDRAALISRLTKHLDRNLAAILDLPVSSDNAKRALRMTYLAASWTYAAAGPSVVALAREAMTAPNGIPPIARSWKRYLTHVAGRSFQTTEDARILFTYTTNLLDADRSVKYEPIKSCSEILRFREDAYLGLDATLAYKLVDVATKTMANEMAERNIKNKFFVGAQLLLGVLRYRIVDPGFLGPEDHAGAPVVQHARRRVGRVRVGRRPERNLTGPGSLKGLLTRAHGMAEDAGKARSAAVIAQVLDFVENRGTNKLIFRDIAELPD